MGALSAAALSGTLPPFTASAHAETTPLSTPVPDGLEVFLESARRSLPAPSGEPADLAAWEAAVHIRAGRLGASELVEACLRRIDRLDGEYLAFNHVMRDASRRDAQRLDRQGPVGALHGIPIAVKDNYFTRGVPTTANSGVYENFVPDHDATVIRRLVRSGGIMLGKTQMGPLATTRALTSDGRITTVNAWAVDEPDVSPGGSSSGSATAVAGRLATSSIGTQTGGSITGPALAQGLTALKPTMGRVSLSGVIPLTYTRDHPGPLSRDARDAAMLLQAMAGPDPTDPRTLGLPPVPDYLTAVTPVERGGRPGLRWPTRIGVTAEWTDHPSNGVRRARRGFLEEMERRGAELVHLDLPARWEELTSRGLNHVRLPERSELFLDVLQRDVRLFGVALSSWINGLLLSGDQYLKGQRARMALLQVVLDELFAECDVIVQTSSIPFDMIGLPLIAFPITLEERSGRTLPRGVLLGGLPFGEERLLGVASAWQEGTDWHRRRPVDPPIGRDDRAEGAGGPARGRLGVEDVATYSA
ncbi:MAG: amidase [Gemmatimonadota bacterium]